MYDALFDEIAAIRDAWGWSANEALIFIGENLDMYDGLVAQYDSFMDVMDTVYGESGVPMTLH